MNSGTVGDDPRTGRGTGFGPQSEGPPRLFVVGAAVLALGRSALYDNFRRSYVWGLVMPLIEGGYLAQLVQLYSEAPEKIVFFVGAGLSLPCSRVGRDSRGGWSRFASMMVSW